MKNPQVCFNDLGNIDYKEAWDYQEKLFDQIVAIKLNTQEPDKSTVTTPNHLLFCEHPHVFTLGKSGSENNLLISMLELSKVNATYYKINRGGDITYHGPGQIVGYPILDLENFGLNIKSYIYHIEEAIIKTLAFYGITSGRLEGATGVWLDATIKGKTRKICAIGVRASRHVTMHGFAFNVNTDLSYFNLINPCGFTDKAVTSLQKELGSAVELAEVKKILCESLRAEIGFTLL